MNKNPTRQIVTPRLRRWIVQQAQAGHTPEVILAEMQKVGWHANMAAHTVQATLTEHLRSTGKLHLVDPLKKMIAAGGVATADPAEPGKRRLPEPVAVEGAPLVDAGDRQVQILCSMQKPRVIVFGGLLSAEECEALIASARPRLNRSLTVEIQTGGEERNAARTSDGMFFQRGETELIARIEARIARLLNWPVINGEGLQVLNYKPGAEYKPHYDYFDPAAAGSATILKRGGQRLATLVMYLNDPEKGGGTTFPDVHLEVAPQRGNAVFFSYDRADPATKTLHGGAPVLAGEKWVATKWLREGEFR